MNPLESRARSSQSKSFQKLNPHLFGKFEDFPETMKAKQTVTQPKKKRIRQSEKPLLNNLEMEFLRDHKALFPVYAQSVRFRLGNGIWYKPDCVVFVTAGRTTAYEVKGPHSFRGGFENLKVAAGLYPAVRFILVWKDNGQWCQQDVLP